jgi:hypothetical protein
VNVLEHPAITDPSRDNIMDLLEQQCSEAEGFGRVLMRPEVFCPDQDLAQITTAKNWWPRECPPQLNWATSFGGSLALHSDAANTETLLTHLHRQANRVASWLQAEGRDVVHPNEDKADRMRRRNRERVQAHRERQREAGPDTRPAALLAWDKVVDARRYRAEVIAGYDQQVRELYDAMNKASEERRLAKARCDELVSQAEAAHRAAKSAPDLTRDASVDGGLED